MIDDTLMQILDTWNDHMPYTPNAASPTQNYPISYHPQATQTPSPFLTPKLPSHPIPKVYSDFPPFSSTLSRTPKHRTKPTLRHRLRSRIIIQRIQQQPQMVIKIILILPQHIIQIIQFLGIIGFQFVGDLGGGLVAVGGAG